MWAVLHLLPSFPWVTTDALENPSRQHFGAGRALSMVLDLLRGTSLKKKKKNSDPFVQQNYIWSESRKMSESCRFKSWIALGVLTSLTLLCLVKHTPKFSPWNVFLFKVVKKMYGHFILISYQCYRKITSDSFTCHVTVVVLKIHDHQSVIYYHEKLILHDSHVLPLIQHFERGHLK